jgi:hypothetical protein
VSAFFFRIEGPTRERVRAQATSLADARVEAVRHLGAYLADHPDLAEQGHWRLLVEDELGGPCFHVIVATVPGRHGPDQPF